MLLKLVGILIMFGWKYHQENAKNEISERLYFNISILPRLLEKSGYGPEATEREIACGVEFRASAIFRINRLF